MKRTFAILLFMLVISIYSTEAQFAIGGGIAYTSNTNDIGVQIKTQFSIGQRWRVEGAVNGYATNNNRDFYGDANLNGNFIFTKTEKMELHALVGYNVFFGRISSAGLVPPTSSELAQGFNVGAGLQYEFNSKLKGFMDVVLTFTDYDQPNLDNRLLFALGVIYEFNNSQSD